MLEYINITFIYNINFFIIFSKCSTMFTDTINNIPLTIAVIFGVFVVYAEQLQYFDILLQCGQ